jgi:4-hydroxy-2-oxoheptanedioate aldolase
MRISILRQAFANGETAVNGWVSGDSRYLAEVLSNCGFDAVTIDLQHGMFGLDGALGLIQAVSAGPSMPMVRCSSLDAAQIGKLLDGGAYGVICPSIDTPEQARQLVRACRYPPRGARSFGPSRGLLYGGPDYVEHFEEEVLVWAMIESAQALENVEDIVAVEGIDGVYVGPNDLALSLGHRPGSRAPAPQVAEAMLRIMEAAHEAGRVAGAFCADGAAGAELADIGYDMVTPGNDAGILRSAATARIAQVRARRETGPAPIVASTGGY